MAAVAQSYIAIEEQNKLLDLVDRRLLGDERSKSVSSTKVSSVKKI